MPIKKCQKNKQKGLKYGDSGHCYTGKDAREKAGKQARAIKANQNKRKKL